MPNKDLVLSDGSTVRIPAKQLALWGESESAVAEHIERVRSMNERLNKRVAAIVETSVGHRMPLSTTVTAGNISRWQVCAFGESKPVVSNASNNGHGMTIVTLVNQSVSDHSVRPRLVPIDTDLLAICDWLSSDSD